MPKFRVNFEISSHMIIEAEDADEALRKFDRFDVEDLLEDGCDDLEVIEAVLIKTPETAK